MNWTLTKFDKALMAGVCLAALTAVQQVLGGLDWKTAVAGAIATPVGALLTYLKANAS